MRTLDDAEVERQARLHDEARQTAIQIDPATVDHPDMTCLLYTSPSPRDRG